RRYGYTAQETLDLAQSLYEEYKLLSYPRTESRYLSTDLVSQLPKILSVLPRQWAALAAYMKQSGLGTPATRAAIIERLLATGYIERKKKSLIPTTKGITLIGHVHVDLKDIALTASWEQRLSDMQDGKLPLAAFESDIAGFVARI